MYPKNKYRADVPVRADGHLHHVRVEDPLEEDALGEGWHDSPNDAVAALEAPASEDADVSADAATDEKKPRQTRAELRAARAAAKA